MLPFNNAFFLTRQNNNNVLTFNDRDLNKIHWKEIKTIKIIKIKVEINQETKLDRTDN